MLRGFFGNLIFVIIARMLCGNHLKIMRTMTEDDDENSDCVKINTHLVALLLASVPVSQQLCKIPGRNHNLQWSTWRSRQYYLC